MKRTQEQILARVQAIIQAAVECALTTSGSQRIGEICFANTYAEPGYDTPESGLIAIGNWNNITRWSEDAKKHVQIDNTPERVTKLFAKLGVELQWCDEWYKCADCGGIVRRVGSCYDWQPAFRQCQDGDIVCEACTLKDPTDYLAEIEGNPKRAVTLNIDLEEHDYVLLEEDFEHGFHQGQDASPNIIAKALKEQSLTRFIFEINNVGQFDMTFSVWLHKDDFANVDHVKWEQASKNGPSVSEGLRRALQDASMKMSQMEGKIQIVGCDAITGSATVKTLTPAEFVEGVKPE